mgnify:CR=1 FL=1
MAVKITVAKIVDGGDYAKQFAGHTTCVNCGNKQAVIINDTDDLVQNWRIECGECDHHIEDVEVEVVLFLRKYGMNTNKQVTSCL